MKTGTSPKWLEPGQRGRVTSSFFRLTNRNLNIFSGSLQKGRYEFHFFWEGFGRTELIGGLQPRWLAEWQNRPKWEKFFHFFHLNTRYHSFPSFSSGHCTAIGKMWSQWNKSEPKIFEDYYPRTNQIVPDALSGWVIKFAGVGNFFPLSDLNRIFRELSGLAIIFSAHRYIDTPRGPW